MAAEDHIQSIIPLTPSSPASDSPLVVGNEMGLFPGGDMSNPVFSGKETFTSTKAGFRMGIDPTDGLFKWILGSSFGQIDYNVTSPGVLTLSVPQTGGGTNGIVIRDDSFDSGSAMSIFRTNGFNGEGDGLSIYSSAGPGLRVTQESNTSSIFATGNTVDAADGGIIEAQALAGSSGPAFLAGVYGTGHGAVLFVDSTAGTSSTPLVTQQYKATNTNYYRHITMNSAAVFQTTIWNANGVSPVGVLTGEKGDLCLSSTGDIYVNQNNGTAWANISGWKLLGETTLSGQSSSISVTDFPAAKNLYIKFQLYRVGSGTMNFTCRFNNDQSVTYDFRYGTNGAAMGTTSQLTAGITPFAPSINTASKCYGSLEIGNGSDGYVRSGFWTCSDVNQTTVTSSYPDIINGVFNWAKATQITTIGFFGGAANFDVGSTIQVFGSGT